MTYISHRLIGIFVLTLLLSACGTVVKTYQIFAPDRDTAYLDARASPTLVLPEGMTIADNYHSPYIIPAGPLPGADAEPMSLVPPGGQAVWDKAQAEVQHQNQGNNDQ